MSKIIKITEEKVSIGLDNGTITEVSREGLGFEPILNDEVTVFQSETETIVSKAEPIATPPQDGININIQNSNNAGYAEGMQGKKLVNKVVYCVLALFLGSFGIHKFYSGKIAAGVVYILFSWAFIPTIISFIEFIIGLTKPADAAGNILI